ncbi:hydrolase, partial [Escherichia coli]|nr:hydrolase [Escherichia coli]
MNSPVAACSATSAGQKYRFFSIIMKINLPFIHWSRISND